MLFGGVIALVGALVVAENTVPRLAAALVWLPFPFSAAFTLASWLQTNRTLELWLLVVGVALQFFLTRFVPPFGLVAGLTLFVGFLLGFSVRLPLVDSGRVFIVAVVAAVAVLAARLLLCYPMPREDLLRAQRAFVIEARRAVDAAAIALDPDTNRAVAVGRMRRALRRLNVTAVIIDGRLAQPQAAGDADTAELLHQYLFDAELAVQGIGQAVEQLTSRHVPARLREAMVVALELARDAHLDRSDTVHSAAELIRQAGAAPLHAMGADEAEVRALTLWVADLLDGFASGLASWLSLGRNSPAERARVPFQPTVVLEGNRPAGTGAAARRVANVGRGWRRVIPYVRVPLQAAIATAIVLPIAYYAVDPGHFYWGVIGVMVGLVGSNTTTERVRKLAHRMVGTVIGAVIGILLVHAIGPGHIWWTLAVIVVALALGAFGTQYAYAFWVISLVTALIQLYAMTTPSSGLDWLLTKRLLLNALGIVVAGVCAAAIAPVSTRKIVREAGHAYLSALEQLITQVALRWKEPDASIRLRGAARAVDAALLQVQSVMRPLVRMPLSLRGRRGDNALALLGTATRHAHVLAATADIDITLAPSLLAQVERITAILADSLRVLDQQFATGQRGTWVRVSPIIGELESALQPPEGPHAKPLLNALHELAAIDEVLAGIAENRRLEVTIPAVATPATTRS